MWWKVRANAKGLACLLCAFLIHCGPPSWPGGVHAVFGWSPQGVRVAEVAPQGPAARAGLAPDDRLIAIDGVAIAGLPTAEVQKRLSGEVGTVVVLRVERAGQIVDVPVERAPYRPHR